MRNRSWRRAQRERAIARAERRASALNWWDHNEDRTAWIRRSAVTPHPCSNYCCGNPRKWFGDSTLQEQRADDWEADLRELVESKSHKDNHR